MIKCKGLTKDGGPCGRAAGETGFCRWHATDMPDDVIGDDVFARQFDNWSRDEIYSYVVNLTGGRVKLHRGMPIEAMIEHAREAIG